ncbi:YbdD/YjiX family protein [Fictibacillus gelatini]|uniref:YbdD/YjiX family protein n=1 Tax=Fictibacillus gelatini TaxID=225985 RepID=UPI000414035E|nr:YbdD/YjiX family protein [Fictibacillus gelatini]
MNEWFEKIANGIMILRKIGKGVSNLPDYEAYVNHLKTHHPEITPPSEKEFFKEYLEKKYGASAQRCC